MIEGAPSGHTVPMARTTKSTDGARTKVVVDDVDKALIEALQQDGRLPYTKLAVEVGLSEAAVRQRVQRLVEAGVVQIVAVTDPMTLGFRRMAMIGLKVEGDLRTVANDIAAQPEGAVLACRRVLDQGLEHGFEAAIAEENRVLSTRYGSEENVAAVMAFFARKKS